MKLRKQSGFVTPPELVESSRINTLFVDGDSSQKDALEGTDALLHTDILGISANLLSKGHSKRIFALLSSVHLVKSDSDTTINAPAITILGDNPVDVKYGRPYVEYGASLAGVFDGATISIDISPTQLPVDDTLDGTAVKYSASGADVYRGVNWLSAVASMVMVNGDVAIGTGDTFVDDGVTLIAGNEDLTVEATSDVQNGVVGSYTVVYNAISVLDVTVDTLIRNVTIT